MMGSGRSMVLKGFAVLVLVWAGVWGLLTVAGVFEVTPEKVVAFVEREPIDEIEDENARREWLERLAGMVNQFNFEQRRIFREGNRPGDGGMGRGDDFWEDLDRDERAYFIDLTMSESFKQMMKGFNDMEDQERRAFVERARTDMARRGGESDMARLEREDEELYNRIVNEGMESYYRDASADTKRDLAPLMEEMQRLMENPNHRERRQMMRTRPTGE
ncbi:MAG: hypothetical protein AAF591_11555 [Verrucomicrobiota bacterium]